MSAVMVVWTVLPDPTAHPEPNTAILTLVASPRLGPGENGIAGETLSDYPPISQWPSLVTGVDIEFTTAAGGSSTAPAVFVDDPPDTSLWAEVFRPGMPVQPFSFPADIAETPIKSYPAQTVADSLAQRYADLLASDLEHRVRRSTSWEPIDRLIDDLGMSGAQPPAPLRRIAQAWTQLADFHHDPSDGRRRSVASSWSPTAASGPEFHSVLAALADHPVLMSRLGLTRRLRVRPPAGLGRAVRIRPKVAHPGTVADYRPHTRCVLDGNVMRLATHDDSAASLLLPLDDTSRFSVIDVDTDRSGLALRSYAASLAAMPRDQAAPQLRPPALRSDGIFVAEAAADTTLQTGLRRATAMDNDLSHGGSGAANDLAAEDILHGYRVDVFDESSRRWYPLCRRKVTYTVGAATIASVTDEGYVSTALGHGGTDDQPTNQLHQAVFRWTGWSMVAPPLGKMLDGADELADPVPPAAANTPYRTDIAAAPGSLPALRYGRVYRLRARLVDVAGRSLEFTPDPDLTAASPAIRFRRYDPVPPPVVVSRRAVTAGESASVLVVRTDNSDPADIRPGLPCERHLLAPKAAVATLAFHGVLDIAGEHRPDPAVYRLLAERDKAVVTGSPDPNAKGAPFVDADTMELPWLPDPMSAGFSVRELPGGHEFTMSWAPDAAWHRRRPIRLILEPAVDEHPQQPRGDGATGTLRISLPPATSTVIQLSTSLAPGSEELLGGWQWATQDARLGPQLAAARDSAVAGAIPQLCPPRQLTLIHALRCPRVPPQFGELQAIRGPGETGYLLGDTRLSFDPLSTHSVHAHADWTDIIDNPDEPAPREIRAAADLVPSEPVGSTPDAVSPTSFRVPHSFGDTRHRVVTYTPVGTSRFAAFFAQRKRVRLTGTADTNVAAAFVAGTVVVHDIAQPQRVYSPDRDILVNPTTGTLARRPESSLADGAEVEVEFVVPPVTRQGQPTRVHVYATARPAPPVVHSVVPAFRWSREQTGSRLISTRVGNMLRIYLHRPWYDSGHGEQLAILVSRPGQPSLERAWAYGSHFNDDPVFNGNADAGALQPEHLAGAAHSAAVLVPNTSQHPGPPIEMTAVGFDVEFDPVRRLWFSDITIQPGPFVRLRVARFQPDAIVGLELSATVDTGFHLKRSERKLSVTVTGNRADVLVVGHAPQGRVSQFTVSVQVGLPPGGDQALWTQLRALPEVSMAGGGDLHTATVTLPATPGQKPMRLLVREYLVLPGDLLKSTGMPTLTNEDVRRLDYFDVVEL